MLRKQVPKEVKFMSVALRKRDVRPEGIGPGVPWNKADIIGLAFRDTSRRPVFWGLWWTKGPPSKMTKTPNFLENRSSKASRVLPTFGGEQYLGNFRGRRP